MAQLGSSGIAGVVKDATGAVLPGVTVEAASPALIEKVRTVVSDGEGQYKIVSLSPGTYSVTFTLPGFGSVKREGIDLASNFTATINAELRVGDIAETVTVSGQSPVVDIQNTSVRNLIRQEILDAIPTNKTLGAWAALTPGMVVPGTSMDVGGSKGEQSLRLAIHGGHGGEQRMLVDGMNTSGGGSDFGYIPNPASAQDVSLELGAGTAEAMLGGVLINFIPKDGGNRFSGLFSGNFANHSMQASNLSDEVKARGLTELSVNKVHDIWEYNGTLGGPIFKDKLWFFTAHRRWGNSTQVAGIFHNATQDGWVFTPDYSRPGYSDYLQRSQSIRLTWQASTRNKVRLFFDYQNHCDCHRGLDTGSAGNGTPTAPEAAHYRKYFPNNVPQASWSFPATSKLLFEAGVSARIFIWTNMPEPGVTANTISITESSNNFLYHAAPNYGEHLSTQANQRFAVSYITGSHAFKTGLFVLQEWRRQTDDPNLGVTYQFRDRPTDPIDAVRRADEGVGSDQPRPWALRAGSVDDQEADAESRCAIRLPQGICACATPAGRPVRAGARLCARQLCAVLEGSLAAPQCRLRSLWQRQDRGEGERWAICRPTERRRYSIAQQPCADNREKRDACLGRRQQRFHPTRERARAAVELELREEHGRHNATRPMCCLDLASGTITGRRVSASSTSCFRAWRRRWRIFAPPGTTSA